MLLQQASVFGDSAADALPPHPETGGFQRLAHDVDDLTLHEAGALFYFLKAGAVLPCITDDAGNLFWRAGRFHGVWDSVSAESVCRSESNRCRQ